MYRSVRYVSSWYHTREGQTFRCLFVFFYHTFSLPFFVKYFSLFPFFSFLFFFFLQFSLSLPPLFCVFCVILPDLFATSSISSRLFCYLHFCYSFVFSLAHHPSVDPCTGYRVLVPGTASKIKAHPRSFRFHHSTNYYELKIINHHDDVNRCVVQAAFDRPALVAVEERGMMSMAARVCLH